MLVGYYLTLHGQQRPAPQEVRGLPVDVTASVGRRFASSGERTRAISVALSQSSQRIVTSAPPPERARTSSFATGSEDPQSGQVSALSRAIPAARRFCWSESLTLPVTLPVYLPWPDDAPDAAGGVRDEGSGRSPCAKAFA